MTEKWNPISAAIRFSTRSWASHAEFVDIDRGITVGARAIGGVKIRPCWEDHYTRIEWFTAAGIEQAYLWATTQIGKPYDFSAVTGIALDRDWRNDSRWFCSELVAAAFEKVKGPLLSTRPSNALWRVTPRDLLMSRDLNYIGARECQSPRPSCVPRTA